MSVWSLELRQSPSHDLDASPIRLAVFRGLSQIEIEKIPLDGLELGELFRVQHSTRWDNKTDRLALSGNLSRFNNVASQHHQGEFIVEGSVGNGLGAPIGTSQTGMRGGLVHVRGNAGDYAAHRMRRGVIIVEGNVGALLASQMIAGTILVGGTLGAHPAYCMRRGTLVLSHDPDLCSDRFSPPVRSFTPFQTLLARSIRSRVAVGTSVSGVLDRLESSGQSSRRGDFAVGGQGEIFVPCGA